MNTCLTCKWWGTEGQRISNKNPIRLCYFNPPSNGDSSRRSEEFCSKHEVYKPEPDHKPEETLSTGLRIERKQGSLDETISNISNKLREIAERKEAEPSEPQVQSGTVFFTKVDVYGFYWYTIALHNDIKLKFSVAPEVADQFRFCISDMERRESKKEKKTVSAASPAWKEPNPISHIDDVTGH